MKDPDVETVGEPARASYIRTLALPATAKRFSATQVMLGQNINVGALENPLHPVAGRDPPAAVALPERNVRKILMHDDHLGPVLH